MSRLPSDNQDDNILEVDPEVLEVLSEDSQAQRLTARSYTVSKYKTSVRGSLMTPYHMQKNQYQKNKYKNEGEIKIMHLYEDIKNIPTWDIIRNWSQEKFEKDIRQMKEFHPMKDLLPAFGISDNGFYVYVNKHGYDVGPSRRGGRGSGADELVTYTKRPYNRKSPKNQKAEKEVVVNNTPVSTPPAAEKYFFRGYKTTLCDIYEKEEVEARILSIVSGLMKNKLFDVKLEIIELDKPVEKVPVKPKDPDGEPTNEKDGTYSTLTVSHT